MTSLSLPVTEAAQRPANAQPASGRIYPATSKILHWLTAVLVGLQLLSGVAMKQLGGGPWVDFLFTLHKTTGAIALGLIVARLGFRLAMWLTGRWRRYAAMQPVHVLLYGTMLAIPLLGWAGISDYGARTLFFGISLPAIWPEGAGYHAAFFSAHTYLAFILLALVALHIGMALGTFISRGATAGEETAPGD